MKLKIAATNVKQGGATVEEHVIDRPTREAALTEGIAELLMSPNFPPEAVNLYRAALARGFSRDETQDQLLESFGLQFFSQEVTDIETGPPVNRSFPPNVSAPPPGAQSLPAQAETPRQLLRTKLAGLLAQQTVLDKQFKAMKRQRDSVKAMVEECRRLLRAPRKPKLVSVRRRKETPVHVQS